MTVRRSLATACVGEFARLGSDRRPQAYPVTPLLLEDRPAVAYPYARAAEAREVAGSPAVAMVISDDRMSGGGWQPVAVTGRPRLVEDREGALFASALLTDELRKHPPSRPLIDSPLLRREHWWYLPRLIVVIEEGVAMPVGARPEGLGEVLPLADGPRQLYVDTVGYTDEGGDRVPVTSLAGREPVDGPAVMLGHDFSSDLESWTPWVWRGRLSGSVLAATERPGRTSVEPRPKLWARLRRQQRLERECRRALAP